MRGFRNSIVHVSQSIPPSEDVYETFDSVPVDVCPKGGESFKKVEVKRITQRELARRFSLPKSEDYQLRDMLAAGQMPEMINVHGMLDSTDPTDLQNLGVGDKLFDKLADMAPSKSIEPVSKSIEPVSEPVEPVTPTEPTPEPSK